MANSNQIAGFLVVLNPSVLSAKIPYYYGTNVIGRSESKATLIIKDLTVSQMHASLIASPGKVVLVDLGSKNFTKINGSQNTIEKNQEVTIDESMIIYFGEVKCKIEINVSKEEEQAKKSKEIMKMFMEDSPEKKDQKQEKIPDLKDKPLKEEHQKPNKSDEFDVIKIFQDNNVQQEVKHQSIQEKKKEEKKKQKKVPVKKQQKNEEKKVEEAQNKPKDNPKKSKAEKEKKDLQLSLELEPKKQQRRASPRIEKKKEEEKNQNKKSKEQQNKLLKPANLKKDDLKENDRKKKEKKESPSIQKSKSVKNQKKDNGMASREHKEFGSKQTDIQSLSGTTKRKMNRKRMPRQPSHEIKLGSGDLIVHPRRSFVGKRILCSNFIPQLKRKFFFLVENPLEEFDFLVMKDYKRTFKALLAICRGIPIVDYQWVQQSQNFEKIMRHEYYTFKNVDYIYQAIESRVNGKQIFLGYDFFLASKNYHLKIEQLEVLVKATGGSIMKKFGKDTTKQAKENTIVLVMNKDKKNEKQFEEDIKTVKKNGLKKVYTVDFLLDSCERQKVDWAKNVVGI